MLFEQVDPPLLVRIRVLLFVITEAGKVYRFRAVGDVGIDAGLLAERIVIL